MKEKIIVVLAVLLVASFIELTYGSVYLGLLFVTVFSVLLFTVTRKGYYAPSTPRLIVGITIVTITTLYNIYTHSEFQTLDIMTILLGFSLILSNIRSYSDIGFFLTYLTSTFVLLYITLTVIPKEIGFNLPYYYGHYLVMVPVVYALQRLGYNIVVTGMRSMEVCGKECIILKIDLACFGWYSLFLLIGIVVAYSRTVEKMESKKMLGVLIVLGAVSYISNLLRVAILVYTAYEYGMDTMLMLHSHLGWILFALISLPITFYVLKN